MTLVKVTNLEELRDKLKPFIGDYLKSQGINPNGKFSCVMPDHDDSDPSMIIGRNGNYAYCFGCNSAVDIFSAAHILENKPLEGQGFVETVAELAERFGFEVEKADLSTDDILKVNAYRAYQSAYEYIIGSWKNFDPKKHPKIQAELDRHNWTVDLCKKNGVGFILDSKHFVSKLKQAGFGPQFLDDVDLYRRRLKYNPVIDMGKDGLIFTWKDANGRPIGFITRNLAFDKTKDNTSSKFCSTHNSCPIFIKGSALYNIDYVKTNRFTHVYVVEGFGDAITMKDHGIHNVVAIVSTALTKKHVEILRKHGITKMTLALDGDKEGQKNIERILDNVLAGCYDLTVDILDYDDDMDPDEYINTHGIDKFKALEKRDAFEWNMQRKLDQGTFDEQNPESYMPLLKLIVNDPNWISRDYKCKVFSKVSGIEISFVRNEIERLSDIEKSHIEGKRAEVLEDLAKNMRSNPEMAEQFMDEAQDKLENINDTVHNSNPLDPLVTIQTILQIKAENEAKGEQLPGLDCGFPNFTDAIGGIPPAEALLVFGGIPNSGKSSWIAHMLYNLVKLNPESYVMLHTTDDTLSQFIPRLICIDQYSKCMKQVGKRLELRKVMHPNYYYRKEPEMFDFISDGYKNVCDMLRNGNFDIKDMTARADAKTIGFGEFLMRKARDRWTDRDILYVLDNFHKCDDFDKLDERIRYKRMSGRVKDLCQKHRVTALSTMEYNKIRDRREPNNSDLSETGKMEYDANLIYHVHNEFHAYNGDTELFWTDYTDQEVNHDGQGNEHRTPKRKPIIKMICGKTKLGDDKRPLYYRFDPAANHFEEISHTEVSQNTRDDGGSDDALFA